MSGDRPSLVDAHAHFHPLFTEEDFFDRAARNFRQGLKGLVTTTAHARACLVLVQGAGRDTFRRWRRRAETTGRRGEGMAADRGEEQAADGGGGVEANRTEWRFVHTDEEESVVVRRGSGIEIVVVAGRQVRTRERLEVLALGTDRHVAEGATVEESLEAAREAGGIPVLAWGFGKWWGRRGKRVDELVRGAEPGDLWLGDQRGRPLPVPAPSQFRVAARRGIPVLPGTDPLPLPTHARRAGSYGLVLDRDLGTRRPAAELRRALVGMREQPRRYGRRDGLIRSIADQIALRLRTS